MKFITDTHTHSYPASHDAKDSLAKMLSTAQEKGVAFYGISNHFDYDYDLLKMTAEERIATQNGDPQEHFHEARHLQEDYAGVMNVIVGAEFGYSDKIEVQERYLALYKQYDLDYVINSVHGRDGMDFARYTFTGTEQETYAQYLQVVRRSLDVIYPYDVVGHIEYIVRYVPFARRELLLADYREQIDDILLAIIRKGKILEVNSATKDLPRISLPGEEIVRRYFELGGRAIAFGSDAHTAERIVEKREEIIKMLKDVGFTYVTVPCRGEYIKVEI